MTMEPTNSTSTTEPPAWRPSDHDPDPRKWSNEEIAAGLNSLPLPECTLYVHRKDRHNPKSDVMALTLTCSGAMSYDAITQLAGLFETPHIDFMPDYRRSGDASDDTCPCEQCVEPFTAIVVRWEATPAASKRVSMRGNVEVTR